jgi:Ca2+-binding RTX toxin-like protein
LYGGHGDDRLVDRDGGGLYGGDGDDVLAGSGVMTGGAGNDLLRLLGGQYAIATGGDGQDTLVGGRDYDSLNGGAGDDRIRTGDNGEPSPEWAAGEAGNDTLAGGGGAQALLGQEGDDVIEGGAGHDLLAGGLGFDRMFGGDGIDQLMADGDRDLLTGGADGDYFVFSEVPVRRFGGFASGTGIVTDFDPAEDRLVIGSPLDLDAAGSFARFQAHAHQRDGRIVYDDPEGWHLVLRGVDPGALSAASFADDTIP